MTDENIPILKNIKVTNSDRITGQIFNDKRFDDGTWVTTSTIKEIRTRNTLYKVEF